MTKDQRSVLSIKTTPFSATDQTKPGLINLVQGLPLGLGLCRALSGPKQIGLSLCLGLELPGPKQIGPLLGWTRTPRSKANRSLPWTRTPEPKANRALPWTRTSGSAPGSDSQIRARIGLWFGLGLCALRWLLRLRSCCAAGLAKFRPPVPLLEMGCGDVANALS
jgi:hypothetical protein